jgi:hypothetical protein
MTLTLDKAFIEQIVREVIKNLKQKPSLLLVHGESCDKAQIDKVAANLQANWYVTAVSFGSPDILAMKSDIKHVVFMDFDQDILIRGALGLTDTPESKLLAHTLQNGISVTMMPAKSIEWILQPKESGAGRSEPSLHYRQHILKHKDILGSFGANFTSQNELQITAVVEGKISSQMAEESLYFTEKVLTQRDIQLTDVKTIHIARLTIVTPLAHDAARNKGITILVKET